MSLRTPLLFLNPNFVSKEQLLFLYSTFSLFSYCDMNTFYCNQYQSYHKGIPFYLHDSPREFVLHCLERQKVALGSDLSGITCQGRGLFSVLCFTNNLRELFEVYFRNEYEMPKCIHYDWSKAGYLCKHFFVVFENFHNENNSPFLNLNKAVTHMLKENILPNATPPNKKAKLSVIWWNQMKSMN